MLPDIAIDALKEHRTRQLERRLLQVGNQWKNLDLVFCNLYDSYQNPHRLITLFDKLLKDAGLPDIRFHDLRHSAATKLLSMEVHPKVVQGILGHSNFGITMNLYSHVIPGMQKNALEKWDELRKEGRYDSDNQAT